MKCPLTDWELIASMGKPAQILWSPLYPDHIKENTELYGFALTDTEMEQINALDRSEKHDWY